MEGWGGSLAVPCSTSCLFSDMREPPKVYQGSPCLLLAVHIYCLSAGYGSFVRGERE